MAQEIRKKILEQALINLQIAKHTENIVRVTKDILRKYINEMEFCEDCHIKDKLMKMFEENNYSVNECEDCFKKECEKCEKRTD